MIGLLLTIRAYITRSDRSVLRIDEYCRSSEIYGKAKGKIR